MNVSLPRALQEFVDKRYGSGRYGSKSEVIYEGLRRLMDEEDRYQSKLANLKEAIQEGLNSGEGIEGDEVFTELRQRFKDHKTGE